MVQTNEPKKASGEVPKRRSTAEVGEISESASPIMLAAFSITPLCAGESVGDRVAEAVRIVRASGLPNETNAMFTNIEGGWDEVMSVIRSCIGKVAEATPRVTVTIKLDWRPGEPPGRLRRDMESLEQRLH